MFVLYLVYAVMPYSKLHRRPAAVFYATYWSIFRPIHILTLTLMFFDYDAGQIGVYVIIISYHSFGKGFCMYLGWSWAVFGLLKPLALYWSLRKDSSYWQVRQE